PVPTALPTSATPARPGRFDQRTVTFIGVAAALFLGALDQTIVGTAMPRIAAEFNSLDRYTWVTTAYLLTSTAVVPVVGKLSEQLGRRRVFLTGIVVFIGGSVLCGAAPAMDWLIGFRAFQGIGAGIISGTSFAVIADLFSPAERGRYVGVFSGIFGLASIVGPLTGGAITDHAGWRWVFYVNVPVGIGVFVLLATAFPKGITSAARHIDWQGAVTIGGAAALLAFGFSVQGTDGWAAPVVWLTIGIGTVLLVAGIVWERTAREAVIPPQLFRSSIFSLSTAISFVSGGLMFGTITYIPVFLQNVVGVQATSSGLLLLPLMGGLVAASIVGGQLISRTGRYRVQAITGSSVMMAGLFLLTRLDATSSQGSVTVPMIVIGAGLGLSFPVFSVVSQNAVPQRMMSSATSALQFVRQMGGVLGLAIMGSFFTSRLAANGHSGKVALAAAIHDVFLLSAFVSIVAIVLAAFLTEIPLRTTNRIDEPAAKTAEAAAI
ncbi:MAG TPA: MDR family MFS transporter, partial [Candidatus Dormibacteraeota bacterium]|nr:MDR family MFS transporter [Candidatus Dormibacteraeota bacterium]